MKGQAFNPYLPSWEYNPDGEPHVFGDRLYVYGSHDRFGAKGFCLNDYVCWSAPLDDLSDWRCSGVIYDVLEDPLNPKGRQFGYAPDCARGPDGRYYLFYQLHMDTAVSVAVCDEPDGVFHFYGHVRFPDGHLLGKKKGEPTGFDPGVLVDADGRIYLYVGFSPAKGFMRTVMGLRGNNLDGSWCVELEGDMRTVRGVPKMVIPGSVAAAGTDFAEHPYFEASSPRRYGDDYYLVYSSLQGHELCYGKGKSPWGPFAFGGVLHSNGDVGIDGREAKCYTGNNHGGLVQIGEKYYIFGHRQTNQTQYSRQGIAEEIHRSADGSFCQAEMTSCGLNGGSLKGEGTYPAYIACYLSGKDGTYFYSGTSKPNPEHPYFTQSGGDREKDGDQYIANLRNGSWAGYKYFDIQNVNAISVSVRGDAGKILVRTSRNGSICGEIPVCQGENWHLCTGNMALPGGKQALYFTYEGDGSLDFAEFTLKQEK